MAYSFNQQGSLRWAVASAIASAVLVACGGGGTTGQALTGKVMDGYIKGAIVCLDVNNNGVCNSDEPQTETTAGGAYTLDVPSDAQLGGTNLLVNVPVGAIDEDNPGTPIARAYSMRSVASAQAVVSPLTTILAAHLDSGETEAQALAAMGLTGVDLNEDYVASQNTQVHNVAKLLARSFQAAGTQTAAQMKASLSGLQTSIATAHASTAVMTEEALLALVPESSGGGSTGGTDSPIMTFDESSQPTVEVFGGAAGTIAEGPAGGAGAALQVTRNGGEGWAGAWVPFVVPSDVGTVTVSARVYSPLAGVPIVTKAEWASEQGSGEKQANEQVVVGWQTLTWTFSNLDVTKTYNRFTVLPQLGTVGSGQVFYFDDLTATVEAPSNETGSGGGSYEPVAGAALTFDEDTLPTVEVFGGAQGTVAEAPAGGTGAALQVTRNGGEGWAGAWVPFVVPSDAGTVTVSAEVYSPLAGVPIVTKAEWASEQGSGEKQANEQVVVGWQTLTWTFSNLDATKTYNRFTVLPQLGTVGSGQVFYFDDITATAEGASGETGSGSSGETGGVLTLSSGFASPTATIEGGAVAASGGSNFDDWGNDCADGAVCGKGAGGTGADSSMYFYYQTTSPASGLYSQVEVFAPGVSGLSETGDTDGLSVTTQTKVNFTFNPSGEWYESANNKFGVVLTLGKRYAIGGGCHLQLHGVKAPTSAAATAYSMNLLDEFRVAQDCGTGITSTDVAAALAASPVSSVKILGAGGGAAIIGRNEVASGANLTVANGDGVYPTTVALTGGITFD